MDLLSSNRRRGRFAETDYQDEIELTGATEGPRGQSASQVKIEPTDPSASTGDPAAPAAEGEVNTLIPKKKSRKKREASADEEPPLPPPPMKTIRLTIELLPEGQTREWNITEHAQELGMMPAYPVEEAEVMEEDIKEMGPPAPGGILSQIGEDISAEEIAKRFAHLDKPRKRPAQKKKVGLVEIADEPR